MAQKNFSSRLRIVYVCFLISAFAFIAGLFSLQIIKGQFYRSKAAQQYTVPSSHYFERGDIFFKRKDGRIISAAATKTGYSLAINPKILENPEEAYKKLSQIINLDEEEFFASAGKKDDPYEEIAHRLDLSQAEAIRNLDIKGVNTYSEAWRFYPAENLASQVLGFVGYNGDVLEGRYGLEKFYENILARNKNGEIKMNSFAEMVTDFKKMISGDKVEGDIILTIDPEIQAYLEKTLSKVLEKNSAEMAGGIVIEPKTGRMLAMSAKPDFNPNNYSESEFSRFLNPATQSAFEMGSIMKPLTMAAGLDLGVIFPETAYDDKGYVVLDKRRIENYDGKARGVVTMQEVLNRSLNTGAVFAMQKIGKDKFYDYLINYGFGEKTGVDLPDEITGLLSNLKTGKEIEYATASFGQGIAITPLALASALSALANGGLLMKPYVAEKIKSGDIIYKETLPQEKRRVLKEKTSEEISRMLVAVVDEALMGGTYKMEHYTIAAKTGTAQIHKEEGGGYYDDQYLHTFFGYAPAFDAKFLILLYLYKPQGVLYSSFSLTGSFMDMAKFMINYFKIPPDR